MYIRIKELRMEKNLTKEDISKLLEISPSLYSIYESAKRNVPLHILIKLSKIYNTSIDYIVGITDQRAPYNN